MKFKGVFVTWILFIFLRDVKCESNVQQEIAANLQKITNYIEKDTWKQPVLTVMRRLMILGGLLSNIILKTLIPRFESGAASESDLSTAKEALESFLDNVRLTLKEQSDVVKLTKKLLKVSEETIYYLDNGENATLIHDESTSSSPSAGQDVNSPVAQQDTNSTTGSM